MSGHDPDQAYQDISSSATRFRLRSRLFRIPLLRRGLFLSKYGSKSLWKQGVQYKKDIDKPYFVGSHACCTGIPWCSSDMGPIYSKNDQLLGKKKQQRKHSVQNNNKNHEKTLAPKQMKEWLTLLSPVKIYVVV